MLRMICDLCGKEVSDNGEAECRNFKIKERRTLFRSTSWEYVDAHQSCIRKLLNAAIAEPQQPTN